MGHILACAWAITDSFLKAPACPTSAVLSPKADRIRGRILLKTGNTIEELKGLPTWYPEPLITKIHQQLGLTTVSLRAVLTALFWFRFL